MWLDVQFVQKLKLNNPLSRCKSKQILQVISFLPTCLPHYLTIPEPACGLIKHFIRVLLYIEPIVWIIKNETKNNVWAWASPDDIGLE